MVENSSSVGEVGTSALPVAATLDPVLVPI